MAKAPVITRVAIAERGAALLALIAASETGFLLLTQDEGVDGVNAGHLEVFGEPNDDGTAPVRLTDAGKAVIAPAAPVVAKGKFEIDTDFVLPEKARRGREGGYPFDTLPVGGSFHVAATAENPDPATRLASSVSGARLKYSVATGEKETVTVKEYQKDANGKFVKTAEGKRIVTGSHDEERDVMKITRDFRVVAVGAEDKRGPGARVVRTA